MDKYICDLIKRAVNDGIGELEQRNGKCLGYGRNMDEPHEMCAACNFYEGNEKE